LSNREGKRIPNLTERHSASYAGINPRFTMLRADRPGL